ncbi:hypothetical protein Ciccas_012219 [Cichlidogyrus casuarinus]|uniref:Uncharacterized protein n=1 Tax=Cichlidogyrus casuarinus TaxID=1844966 RepID=A0ABD2PPS8_9PLAT
MSSNPDAHSSVGCENRANTNITENERTNLIGSMSSNSQRAMLRKEFLPLIQAVKEQLTKLEVFNEEELSVKMEIDKTLEKIEQFSSSIEKKSCSIIYDLSKLDEMDNALCKSVADTAFKSLVEIAKQLIQTNLEETTLKGPHPPKVTEVRDKHNDLVRLETPGSMHFNSVSGEDVDFLDIY